MNNLSIIGGIAIATVFAAPSLAQTTPNVAACFSVVPLAAGSPTPALLVDRCTGKTWALSTRIGAPSKTSAPVDWVPIEQIGK